MTAVVKDPQGNLYVNSQVSISFYDPGTSGKLPLLNGSTFQQSFPVFGTDSNALFSISLPDNGVIDSSSGTTGTAWNFRIVYINPTGGQATSFSYRGPINCSTNTPATCTSNTMDISAVLQAAASSLPGSIAGNISVGTITASGLITANGGLTVPLGKTVTVNGALLATGVTTTTQLNGCQYVNANQTFAQALAAVSSPGCIVVSPGTYTVSANAVIPVSVNLVVESGGVLSIATVVTLTVNGPIYAPATQIFAYVGTGVALINGITYPVPYQWFPGSDPGAQVNAAIASLSGKGTILVTAPSYGTTVTFTTNPFAGRTATDRIHLTFGAGVFQFNVPMSIVENTWIQGQGPRTTVLQAGSSGFVVQYCTSTAALPNPSGTCLGTVAAQAVTVTDLTIDGNSGSFSGSGCLLYQNFDLPSRAENIICQNFGSFGGFQFIQTLASAAGAGGSGHNLWSIQSTAGTAGGTISTAFPFVFDSVNHFECRKCFAQYAPAGTVIKNTQNLSPTEIVFVDYENEGIAVNTGSTGVGLDLQANTNGVNVHGWSWLGPASGAGTVMKTASTAVNWDIRDFYSNRTNTTVFNINGTTYTPSNTFVQHFSQGVMQNNIGLEIWTGTTAVPQDPTSPFEVFSNATNCILSGDNGGTIHFAVQCLTGQTTIGGPLLFTNLLISNTAPTIAAGGCGGSAAAIQNANGTASFNIFTGTAPTSGGCTITMPAATTNWHCEANHTSAISTTNFIIQQTGALSTTSVTLQLFSDVAAATAPAASDTWRTTCTAN